MPRGLVSRILCLTLFWSRRSQKQRVALFRVCFLDDSRSCALRDVGAIRCSSQRSLGLGYQMQLRQNWGPVLMGIRPAVKLPTKTGSASLVVKACTLCCGQPVAGIQIDVGEDDCVQSFTDRTGCCIIRDNLHEQELQVSATHSAFMDGSCEYIVRSTDKSTAELPLFLEPLIRIFTIPGPGDQLALQLLVGDGDSVLLPVDAEPFAGTICDARGEELWSASTDPDAIALTQFKAPPEAVECPIICLAHSRVELKGYEWLPSAPQLDCITLFFYN